MGLETQIENLRERIEESDDINEDDRELLSRLDEQLTLLAQQYSDHRHKKLLRHGTIMAEELEAGLLSQSLEDADSTDDILRWINNNYENEETNRDYRSALRVIGKRVTDGDEVPDSLDHVPTGTSTNYDPTPDPRNMLRFQSDVQPMIEAASYSRDKAMIALQFDAGLRGGEFKTLRVGDINDHKHGLEVTVEGKQGRRTVMLIPAVPHVSRWLEDHPDRENPDAPLWTHLNSADDLSDRMMYDVFERAAEKAEVSRPVTLTNFRKSSAAFLASRNLNQAHIEDHHGWVRGSDAAARYISVFGSDTDREIARLHGIDIAEEDEPDDIAPIDCPTCGRTNERDASFCDQCGQALDQQAAAEADEAQTELQKALAELPPEKAQAVFALVEIAEDKDVLEAISELEH